MRIRICWRGAVTASRAGMAKMGTVALIGFGEAGMAFAGAWRVDARAFDIKTDDPALAADKRADYARAGIAGADTLTEALAGAKLVLSLVTADQALAAAAAAAKLIAPGALYCDFNSVAPQTKHEAARLIEAAGALYADVAVMAPVHPTGLAVPLLVSGADACAALAALGFSPRRIDGPVGRASTIKMLRSVMVKGIEALTAECFLAARKAGVADEVAASLDASWPGANWAAKADYNLGRMREHGLRRAAEMEEVAATLEALGQGSDMARATAEVQRRLGATANQASEAA
jgi:3-hydroxyisobutyrate dehydrogenase-like beta-hydroxyacid dehydrogenase